jgi:hypothetical protein
MICTIETFLFERGGVTCCAEQRLNVKRYVTMTVMWIIILAWLALQLPLAVLIGKSIKFGTVEYKKARRAPSRDRRYYPGVVWC